VIVFILDFSQGLNLNPFARLSGKIQVRGLPSAARCAIDWLTVLRRLLLDSALHCSQVLHCQGQHRGGCSKNVGMAAGVARVREFAKTAWTFNDSGAPHVLH
jgi:hypothetical protein